MEETKEGENPSPAVEETLEQSNQSSDNLTMSRATLDDMDNSREQENLKKIEAALFISGRWLSMQELVTLTDLNPLLLRQLIDKLKESYGEDSAMDLINKDNDWKMDVKPEYANLINKLATGKAEFTKAEQETLAVIAYKQPVKQSIIIKIRGNKAYEHVKNFISLGLVKSKKVSHTLELELSEDFYDYFHVSGATDTQHPRDPSQASSQDNSVNQEDKEK
jgi:segregation and condensation protein B